MTRLLEELVRTTEVAATGAWMKPPAPGDRVGRFELLRQLGQGGFGVVFEARDPELNRRVAWKALRPSRAVTPGQAEALRVEAEAAARLNHPGIVTVHDFGTCESGPYVIMELLEGEPLDARLERGPVPPEEAVRVALEVARALAHAHGAGVLHRDLNPGNVFLCASGAVKVLDFGLAQVLGSGGLRGGAPSFTAPEQWRGDAQDGRTDLFGLGCLLYRMLAGHTPLETSAGLALPPGLASPPPLPGVPGRLGALCRRLVATRSEERPGSAAEVAQALERIAREVGPAARRRRRIGVAAAALSALALAAGTLALVRAGAAPPARPAVVVADVDNLTGEPELDGLGGLLSTALDQSRHLTVVSRARLWEVLADLGDPDATRIDEPRARQLGRQLAAPAVLLASLHRFGETYSLELKALDPASERYLFTVAEQAAGRERIPDLVDAVALRVRHALAGPGGARDREQQPVGDAVTRNMTAYRHYFSGLECVARRSDSERVCPDHFLRALEIDPEFAMARHELAYLLGAEGSDEEGARRENALAVAQAGRAPPRERALILAYQAELDGKVEAAVAAYTEAAARWPDDHEVHARAGYYLHRQRDFAHALPFMRRAVNLDPEREDAARLLVAEFVQLGRLDDLRQYAGTWSALPTNPARRSLLVRAWFWLGDRARALEVARLSSAAGGVAAHFEEAVIHFASGDFAAARAALDKDVASRQDDAYVRAGLLRTLEAQGRFEEALALRGVDPNPSRRALSQHTRAVMLAGRGRATEAFQEAEACRQADPAMAATVATDLLLLGDLPHASALGGALPAGSLDARVHAAVRAWREGHGAEALASLKALAVAEPVPSWYGVPPAYALAEVAAALGDHPTTVAAVDRLLSTWHPMSARGGGMVPRAVLLRARAEARLGHRERARGALERLLQQRQRGDPGDPVAAEARALLASP